MLVSNLIFPQSFRIWKNEAKIIHIRTLKIMSWYKNNNLIEKLNGKIIIWKLEVIFLFKFLKINYFII